MSARSYWVHILSSQYNGTLYVGVTNSLQRRIWEHKQGNADGFTKKHRIDRLVYFEQFQDIDYAIRREKEIKGWRRQKKNRPDRAGKPRLAGFER